MIIHIVLMRPGIYLREVQRELREETGTEVLVQGYNNQSYQQGIMTASVSIILQFLQYTCTVT